MKQRAFISHAVEDRVEATAICHGLEERGIRCWIAPRDIRSGSTWAKAVIDGVVECSDMVVVLSEHTNVSDPVIAEVHAASARGRRIIPVRIREVSPEGALEFYLGRAHWFNAFPESIESYLHRLATELGVTAIKAIQPAPAISAPGSADVAKTVHVFFHASDVARTSALATQIANQLESHGWSVTRGYTELEVHSSGVWVHGSTDEQRQFARRLLAQMRLQARVDNRAEDVPLQIIVGQTEHEPRPAPEPPGDTATSLRRIEWITDASSISSVPRLAVRLYLVENKGGTPGLGVKAISDEPQSIEGAHVTITNILRWSEQHRQFVMSRDIYDSGTEFRAMEIGNVTLHPGEVESVAFVHCEAQRVEFNGHVRDQGPAHYRIRSAGIWQVTFRVQAERDGRNQDGFLC
jgi:hypothetical protein